MRINKILLGTQSTELHINKFRCGWLTVIEELSFAFTVNGGLKVGVFYNQLNEEIEFLMQECGTNFDNLSVIQINQ